MKEKRLHLSTAILWTLSTSTALSCSTALADINTSDNAVTELEEIVVTATKKSTSLQDVAMSISAIGTEELDRMGAQGFEDFATAVPSLSFGYGGAGDGRNARSFAIRGISGSNTTGFYVNETPIPNRVDPRLVDVKRIEVLRGPQGTLYGASSMGGTVRIITNKPDSTQSEGLLDATLSNTNQGGWNYKLEGVGNFPLKEDKVALRIAGYVEDESGVFDRVFPNNANPPVMNRVENVDNKLIKGIQVSLGLTPNDDLEIIAKAAVQDTSSDGASWSSELGQYDQVKTYNIPEFLDDEWTHLSLTAAYDFGWASLTSITSYFDQDYNENEEFSDQIGAFFGGFVYPTEINQAINLKKWTQEIRLASSLDGPFNFIIGGYYNNAKQNSFSEALPEGFNAGFADYIGLPGVDIFGTDLIYRGTSRAKSREVALFGELYVDITDDLTVTVGGRWFDVSIDLYSLSEGIAADLSGAVTEGTTTEQGFNPKFLVEYRISDDVLLYATAAKGYRLGGISSFIPDFCGAEVAAPSSAYDSDSLWNYEAGAKTSWADNRVKVNSALYQIDWQDIQLSESFTCGFGRVVNGGKARSRGFEIELSALITSGLQLSAGIGYADAKFTSHVPGTVPVPGDRLRHTPKWTANVALDYSFDVSFADEAYIGVNYTYTGESFSKYQNDPTFTPESAVRDAYSLAHARFGARFGEWDISLFIRNLFDKQANLSEVISLGAEVPGLERYATNRPRTIGLTVKGAF